MTFKDIYKLPLKKDEHSSTYIWSNNNVMTFTVLTDNDKLITDVINKINDNNNISFNNVKHESGRIFIDNTPILLIRGWGHLIGQAALKLNHKKAAQIQDDFAEFVVNKLKE